MARHRWTNEEISEFRKTHGGAGYFNKEDTNVFVRKAWGMGITFNWANPFSYVAIAAIIAAVILIKIFLINN